MDFIFIYTSGGVFITLPDFIHHGGITAAPIGEEQQEAENFLYTMGEVSEETGRDLPEPSELDEVNLRTNLNYFDMIREDSDGEVGKPHRIEIKYIETDFKPSK
ncbi:hypothetical protein [Aquibacillus albus]|uniref:Uncharacterized protein n=1 Tax=Aquibacillus albus TaxID=1168171 RepID=A0ABS2N693_9BACI|nr:hypothetical protein [Aquibacillus albus]MBM7573644.1 hypothetical protein [Aquibacillus albus]